MTSYQKLVIVVSEVVLKFRAPYRAALLFLVVRGYGQNSDTARDLNLYSSNQTQCPIMQHCRKLLTV